MENNPKIYSLRQLEYYRIIHNSIIKLLKLYFGYDSLIEIDFSPFVKFCKIGIIT